MKKRITFLMLTICVFAIVCITACGTTSKQEAEVETQLEDSPSWIVKLAESENAEQIFVVAGIGKTTAYVSMHERTSEGNWKTIITTHGYIGKNGLGKTKEGDAKTPVGTYHFTEAFGIAPDPGCIAFDYKQVSEDDWWSGDLNYQYNKMVSISNYPNLSKDDSEHIIDYTYHYQYCLNVSYNEEGENGKGSAIFLHCLGPNKPYTGGCIAIPQNQMEKVLKNVRKDCIVVIGTLKDLSPETSEDWDL